MQKVKDDYFYPVTPRYLEGFVEKITQAVLAGQSITFIFKPNLGGERALLRFILQNPKHTDLYQKLKDHILSYFEPSDCLDSSNSAFFYQLLKVLSNRTLPDYASLSLQQIIGLLKKEVIKILKKKKLVLFIGKLDSFPNLNPILGNLFYSIWREHKTNFSLVTTFSHEGYQANLKDFVGELTEALSQNIQIVGPLPDAEIVHVIGHMEANLNHQFSELEKKLILRYAHGSPYATKILCQSLLSEMPEDPEKVCRQVIFTNFPTLAPKSALKYDEKKFSFLLGEENITQKFTPQEQEVLKVIVEKQGKVTNRDDVADALWGNKAYEKYSDWAIDKFISLIRNKLLQLNFMGQIKTVKGEGVIFRQP